MIETQPTELARLEDAAWTDAYRIAWVGAANPAAAAGSLGRHSAALAHEIGTAAARKHPALRAMAGQVAFLFSVDRFGPPVDVLDAVEANAVRLGLMEAQR
jgi:hypothetical protein